MIQILGFMPDAEQTTPGLLSDCINLVPSLTGMVGGPSAVVPVGLPPLASECQGAAIVTALNDTRRFIAGTQTAIYEHIGTAWTDVSRGTAYTGGLDSRWSIAQFGNATLMANGTDPIQRSTGAAFADIASAPIAEIVFSVGSFVMALNVNDGADKPNGWHCSAAFDETDWVESTATQSASGQLVATPGSITAGGRLGEYAVAYKKQSIFLGQYVGSPIVWDWIPVPGGFAGCVGKEAWCDVNGVHFFVGDDNFWLFDGTRPVPIGDGAVRKWFAENSNPLARYKIICTFDRVNNLVYVFYPSIGSGTLDSALVYNVLSKKWGRADQPIEAALEYVTPPITIDGWDAYGATIDSLPNVGLDSQFWLTGGRYLAVFNQSHQMISMIGESASSALFTSEAGDDDNTIRLQQIRLRYSHAPFSATCQTFHAMNSGIPYTAGPSGSMNDGKFDALQVARWHKARINFTGPVQVTHMDAKYTPEGTR
jgi:hypothetical protein